VPWKWHSPLVSETSIVKCFTIYHFRTFVKLRTKNEEGLVGGPPRSVFVR